MQGAKTSNRSHALRMRSMLICTKTVQMEQNRSPHPEWPRDAGRAACRRTIHGPLSQIEQQHLGVVAQIAGKLDLVDLGDRRAVAFLQDLAVELDVPAGHLDPGVAAGAQVEADLVFGTQERGV